MERGVVWVCSQDQIRNLKTKELENVKKLDRNEENIVKEAAVSAELDEWRYREELLWKKKNAL